MLYTKTSKGAYKMMADLVRLSDEIANFIIKRSDVRKTSKAVPQKFEYLARVGYIDKVDSNKYCLTDIGKINLLSELIKRRKPDGKLRIVIFDIPEKLRVRRNAFRRHLVELGFKMKQKSVWLSKLPCEDLVHLLIKYHGLKRFASLIVGEVIH